MLDLEHALALVFVHAKAVAPIIESGHEPRGGVTKHGEDTVQSRVGVYGVVGLQHAFDLRRALLLLEGPAHVILTYMTSCSTKWDIKSDRKSYRSAHSSS